VAINPAHLAAVCFVPLKDGTCYVEVFMAGGDLRQMIVHDPPSVDRLADLAGG
jgi:hypothetical protein